MAPQTVGHQNHRSVSLKDGFFQLYQPVTAQGPVPVMLLDTQEAIPLFPEALPVRGPGITPTGQQQYLRVHGQRIAWMRSTISSANATKAWAPLEPGSNTTPGNP